MATINISLTTMNDNEVIENKEELRKFFTPVAKTRITRRVIKNALEHKAVEAGTLIISVLAEWALARFVLDPLADKTKEWVHAVTSLKGKQFKVILKISEDKKEFTISSWSISNKTVQLKIWLIARRVAQISEKYVREGSKIDEVKIVPFGESALAIAYKGKRPTYYIDFEAACFREIPSVDEQMPLNIDLELWKLAILSSRNEYLDNLLELGRISAEEHSEQKQISTPEIEVIRKKLRNLSLFT